AGGGIGRVVAVSAGRARIGRVAVGHGEAGDAVSGKRGLGLGLVALEVQADPGAIEPVVEFPVGDGSEAAVNLVIPLVARWGSGSEVDRLAVFRQRRIAYRRRRHGGFPSCAGCRPVELDW